MTEFQLHPIDWTLLIAYFAWLVWVGFAYRTKKNEGEDSYLLDGRRLTLPAFVASMVSTWYGGILGVGEFSYLYGISNWLVFGVPYYVAALLFAFLLAKKANEERLLTIPEQLERNYGAGPARIGGWIIFITTLPAAYVLILGVLLRLLLGWPLWLGIATSTAFSVFYLWWGGYRSVIKTDAIQFLLMFGSFLLLFILLASKYGFFHFLPENVPETHFTWHGGNGAAYIIMWFFIALSTLVEPTFYQRCFSAKTSRVARNGLLVSVGFWIAFDFLTTMCGMYARALLALPEGHASEAYPVLATKVLPAGLLGLFVVGLFATVMSTVDSYLFVSASTFGKDLIKNARNRSTENLSKLGLIVSGILATLLALMSNSVIDLWKELGTLGACSLMLPLATAFYPRWRFSPKGAMLHLALVMALCFFWIYAPKLSGWNEPLFGVEPVYVGFGLSLVIWLVDRFRQFKV